MICIVVRLCFFFSSRRRHTRFDCDWSSDVCSSDLAAVGYASGRWLAARTAAAGTWYQRGAIVADAAAAHGAQRSFHCSAAVRAASIPLLLNRGTLPPSTVARRALRSVL